METNQFQFQGFNPSEAQSALITLLQNAHAGEKAAANAYFGHGHSLFVTDKNEKNEILKIYKDELHHRQQLKKFLQQLNSQPRLFREIQMWLIGAFIAVLSYFGTWLIPMYGAGRLERSNIGEYEVAARLALIAGEISLIDELLHFAEIEWDHEFYFRKKVESHPFSRWILLWDEPKPRIEIRTSFKDFQSQWSLSRKFLTES